MSLVFSGDHVVKLMLGDEVVDIPHNNNYSRVFDRDSVASVCDIHEKFDTNKDMYQRKSLQGIGNVSDGLNYKHYLDDRCNCILCWIHKKKITPFSLPTNDAKIECVADQLREMRLHRHMPYSQFKHLVDTILPSGSVNAEPDMMKELYNNIWFRIFVSAPLKDPVPMKSFLSDYISDSDIGNPSAVEIVNKMQREENTRHSIEAKRYDLYKRMKTGTVREHHTKLIKIVLKGGPRLELVGSEPSHTRKITTLKGIQEGFESDMNTFFKKKFRCDYILQYNDVQNDLIEWLKEASSRIKYFYLDVGFVSEAQEVYNNLYKNHLKPLISESVASSLEKLMNNQITPLTQEYKKAFYNYEFDYYNQVALSILDDDENIYIRLRSTLRDTLNVINDEYLLGLSIQHSNMDKPTSRINYVEEYNKQLQKIYGVPTLDDQEAYKQLMSRRKRKRSEPTLSELQQIWRSSDAVPSVRIPEKVPKQLSDVELWLKEKTKLTEEDVNMVTSIFSQMPSDKKKWMLAYGMFKKLKKKKERLDNFALRALQIVKYPLTRKNKVFQEILKKRLDAKMQLLQYKIIENVQVVFEWLSEDSRQSIMREWNTYKYGIMIQFLRRNQILKMFKKKYDDKKEYKIFFKRFNPTITSGDEILEKYNREGGYRTQRKMELWYLAMDRRYQDKWDSMWNDIEKKDLSKFKVGKAIMYNVYNSIIELGTISRSSELTNKRIDSKIEQVKENLLHTFKLDISIRLDVQHEAFGSFDNQTSGAINKFLLRNLSPREREAFKSMVNEYTLNKKDITENKQKNMDILEKNGQSMNNATKTKFHAAVSRDNGFLKKTGKEFKKKQLEFKNKVFNRMVEKKFDDIFIGRQTFYHDSTYWATRNYYKDRLLRIDNRVFVLDCSKLLNTWNETTFQIGNVSDRKVNDFLISYFFSNDIKNFHKFRQIIERFNKCGRDLIENLTRIENIILNEIRDKDEDMIPGDSTLDDSIRLSVFSLSLNPDYRINVEDVESDENDIWDVPIIKSISELGIELNSDYTFFQITPYTQTRIENIKKMSELSSDIPVQFDKAMHDYESCLEMFKTERDYLKLLTLPKSKVFSNDNIVKAWITDKRGNLVTVDIERSVEVERKVSYSSSVITYKDKVTEIEQKTMVKGLCFPTMQDFEYLFNQIEFERFNEATAEQQEFREMKNIVRQKQEIAQRILGADMMNDRMAREEKDEEIRIERVRNDVIAQDVLFEEWSTELLTSSNPGQYIKNKIKYCENTPHEALMFVGARSRWVERIQKLYTRVSLRPDDVQRKFNRTNLLQRKIKSNSRIKKSNDETVFYKKLMIFTKDEDIKDYLYVRVNNKVSLIDKQAELSRLKEDFENAMKRYDEKLQRRGRTLMQKPLDKRKRILSEFEKIGKELRYEFTDRLLMGASEQVIKYHRTAMPKEVDFIMYTPREMYSEIEWINDVERSYAPLDAIKWGLLENHVKICERKVPYGVRTRKVYESDFQRLFLVEKNRKRIVPKPGVDLMYEVEKITPPTIEMASFETPVRLAWGPGSWFDIDLSCDLMRHTGLSLSIRKQIEQRIDEQYEIEKNAYVSSMEKGDFKVDLNYISDTIYKNALYNVVRQLTREQAGKEICDAFDTFNDTGTTLDTFNDTGTTLMAPEDWKTDEEKYKVRVYEWIQNQWSKKINNWKDDGKNIRLPDDIIGSFTVDRISGLSVHTKFDSTPTHMRLHRFYLEGVEYRGEITLVPFFIVSLYERRKNMFYRLNIRNRAHKTFLITEQDKYASLGLNATKKFSEEDYKGYKHSLCLNLEEFTQLILKPSNSVKRRITREVPFPLLNKYHSILQDMKKDAVERTLVENKKASIETPFSEPVVKDTYADDPKRPFKGIIRSGSSVSDIYVTYISDEPHVVVVAGKNYIINSDGVLIATIDAANIPLKHVCGYQLVTYRNDAGVFKLYKWTLNSETQVLEPTPFISTPYKKNLDFFGSVGDTLDKFVSFGDGSMHVWEHSTTTGRIEFNHIDDNIIVSPIDRHMSNLYKIFTRMPLMSWKYDKLVYATRENIKVMDKTFSLSMQLRGHEKKVTCLDEGKGSNGKGIIVSGSDDKDLIIWSSEAHNGLVKQTKIYYEEMYSVINDESDSGNEERKKRFLKFKSFGIIKKMNKTECTVVLSRAYRKSTTRKLKIVRRENNYFVCSYKRKNRVVNVRISVSAYRQVLSGHTASVTNVICKDMIYSTSKDKTVRVWNLNGAAYRVLTLQTLELNPLVSNASDINIAIENKRLFYAFGPHVGAYDVQSGKRLFFSNKVVRLDYDSIESGWSSDDESGEEIKYKTDSSDEDLSPDGDPVEEKKKEEVRRKRKEKFRYLKEALDYVNTTVLQNPESLVYESDFDTDYDSSDE